LLISNYMEYIDGELYRDGEFFCIRHVNSTDSGTLCFLDDINLIIDVIENLNVSAVFTTKDILPNIDNSKVAIILCQDPRVSFFKFHNYFGAHCQADAFNFKTVIHPTAIIKTGGISKHGVVIGENTCISENTIIYPGVTIGANSVIGCNNIIGGEGFEFKKVATSVLTVKHFGGVKIGDSVESKEFVSIHKALFHNEFTIIGSSTKVDSGCHIGHGNKVGRSVFLCSKSNISGNSIIEDNVYIGPGVNVPNRVIVGENSKVTIGSTLSKSIVANEVFSGHFAIPHLKYLTHIKSISK